MNIDPNDWTTINRLLDEALERPVTERSAWIRSLKESESGYEPILRRLLSHSADVETGDFLEQLPSIDIALAPEPQSKQRIGPYRLTRKIGVGGMASVWLAERSDGLIDRPVALKLPHSAITDVFIERAERERDLLARLTHPNIARLYDAGVTENGQPYLALEYVEGIPIDEYCNSIAMDTRQRVELFQQVVDAVAYAHTQLVIHRDLKPANVLVTQNGEVRLVDFGIAKFLEADKTTESELTQFGGRAFTTAYASPEQIRGEPLTVAADVYSLGSLLYELLSGHRPHSAGGDPNSTLEFVILHETPKRMSDVADEPAKRRALSGDLDTIALMALAKEHDRRYTSSQALGEDLRRYLCDEPVRAQPDSVGYRLRKFVDRHRVGVAASVVTAVAFAAVTTVAILQSVEATRQKDIAVYQQQRASTTLGFMSFVLQGVAERGEGMTMPELLNRAVHMLEQQRASTPFLASMYQEVAARYLGLGQTDRAVELLTVSQELARAEGDADVLANVLCLTGREHVRVLGEPEIAKALLDEAQDILKTLDSPTQSTYVQCARAIAIYERYEGDIDAAIARLQLAVDYLSERPTGMSMAMTAVLSDIGLAYNFSGRPTEALEMNEQAVRAIEASGRTGTVSWLTLQSNLANAMFVTGEVASALAIRESLRERLEALASVDYPFLNAGTSHASNLYGMGYYQLSLDMSTQTYQVASEAGNQLTMAVADMLTGRTLTTLGRPTEAAEHFDRAEAYFLVANRPVNLYGVNMGRAEMHLALGNIDKAKQVVGDLLHEQGYVDGDRGKAWNPAMIVAARVALAEGDADAAEQYANHAYLGALEVARDPKTNASVGRALLFLGKARLLQGKREIALADLELAETALTAGAHAEHPYALEARMLLDKSH